MGGTLFSTDIWTTRGLERGRYGMGWHGMAWDIHAYASNVVVASTQYHMRMRQTLLLLRLKINANANANAKANSNANANANANANDTHLFEVVSTTLIVGLTHTNTVFCVVAFALCACLRISKYLILTHKHRFLCVCFCFVCLLEDV